MVIPVPPMHKRKISGIVHDESASGKTVFIEPAEVVQTNNRMRELQMEERREIIRILTSVANELRPHIDMILAACEVVAELDFIHAKAMYAGDGAPSGDGVVSRVPSGAVAVVARSEQGNSAAGHHTVG